MPPTMCSINGAYKKKINGNMKDGANYCLLLKSKFSFDLKKD